MGIKNVVKTIKEIHKEDVILIKIGTFYNVYGREAYIISYLFGYKLKENTVLGTRQKLYVAIYGLSIKTFRDVLDCGKNYHSVPI